MTDDARIREPQSPVCFADEGAAVYAGYLEPQEAHTALRSLAAEAGTAEGVADRLRRHAADPALAATAGEAGELAQALSRALCRALQDADLPPPSPANQADAMVLAQMLADLEEGLFATLQRVPDPDIHARLDDVRRAAGRIETLSERLRHFAQS